MSSLGNIEMMFTDRLTTRLTRWKAGNQSRGNFYYLKVQKEDETIGSPSRPEETGHNASNPYLFMMMLIMGRIEGLLDRSENKAMKRGGNGNLLINKCEKM